jgi:hypothetical protein
MQPPLHSRCAAVLHPDCKHLVNRALTLLLLLLLLLLLSFHHFSAAPCSLRLAGSLHRTASLLSPHHRMLQHRHARDPPVQNPAANHQAKP